MPLHLLGKKSWNPYAPAAIARVKADEADAAAREQELDERRDEYDAQVRLARLRGHSPPPPPPELARLDDEQGHDKGNKRASKRSHDSDRKKRRRLPGEDDTDRDIRIASDGSLLSKREPGSPEPRRPSITNDAPIVDRGGHIQLFGPAESAMGTSKRARLADAEAKRKEQKRKLEEPYTVRFSDAAGLRENIKEEPWYAKPGSTSQDIATRRPAVGKNAFGRDDEARHKRDAIRLNASDPMAAMKAAQSKLKTVKQEQSRARAERENDLRKLQKEQSRREQDKRDRRSGREPKKRGNDDLDDLEGFALDAVESSRSTRRHGSLRDEYRIGKERSSSRHRRRHHRDGH